MSPLLRKTLLGVAFGILVYIAYVSYIGVERLGDAATGLELWGVAAALAASSVNYLLRYLKWELCLARLRVRGPGPEQAAHLGWLRSALIYVAGLSMAVTPGKVGEVLRSSLLRASDGVPFTRTAPIVVADRATDLIALILLALVGISGHREFLTPVIGAAILVLSGIVILGSPRLFGGILDLVARVRPLRSLSERARGLVDASAALLGLATLGPLTVLSVIGWGLECVGYWLVLRAFPDVEAGLLTCTFLWAATTLVGALSFMPGGLGATEYALGVLAVTMVAGLSEPVSGAATLIIRACTLWYGTLVGALCLGWLMRDPKMRSQPTDQTR